MRQHRSQYKSGRPPMRDTFVATKLEGTVKRNRPGGATLTPGLRSHITCRATPNQTFQQSIDLALLTEHITPQERREQANVRVRVRAVGRPAVSMLSLREGRRLALLLLSFRDGRRLPPSAGSAAEAGCSSEPSSASASSAEPSVASASAAASSASGAGGFHGLCRGSTSGWRGI